MPGRIRTARRHVSVVITGAAVGALILGSAVAPASAATGLELSRDGTTYSSTISGTLFDQNTISVPGDVQPANLYIRNSSTAAGFLRVTLASVTVSDPLLSSAMTVSASSPAFPGSAAALADAQPCRVLTEGDLVAPGGVVKLSTQLKLGDLHGATGQNGSAIFSLRVSLSDAAVGSLLPTECGSGTDIPAADGGGKIPLAMTGAEPPIALIMGAASILGIGIFLVIAARRRREARE